MGIVAPLLRTLLKNGLAALTIFALSTSITLAGSPHFRLSRTIRHDAVHNRDYETVRVYDTRTRRIIWAATYPDGIDNVTWSPDRRAVAFTISPRQRMPPSQGADRNVPYPAIGYNLVVWRAGEKPKTVADSVLCGNDCVEDMVWSLDKSHLLVRSGGSGSPELDIGNLYCLDIGTNSVKKLGPVLGKPQWIGSKTVKFWTFQTPVDKWGRYSEVRSSRPTLWAVPKQFSDGKA